MTYRGRVQNGVIVLDDPGKLPDGAEVEVRPIGQAGQTRTLYDRLKNVIGTAEGLPSDLAENHDHYLHDVRKRT
jgi:hypothetical protein